MLKDMKQFNSQQDQKQLDYFKYQARMDDTKKEARREYQKQFMEENKKVTIPSPTLLASPDEGPEREGHQAQRVEPRPLQLRSQLLP